jgi:hypothetical protein
MTIYFIECGSTNQIKIGFSQNPAARRSSLQVGSTAPLSILATVPGDLNREGEIQNMFSDFRAKGEWFFPSDKIYEFIYKNKRSFDLCDWIPDASSYQIKWISSDGANVDSSASPFLVTVHMPGQGSKFPVIEIDTYVGIASAKDRLAFQRQGGISPFKARALDKIAKEYGFTVRMFAESQLYESRFLKKRNFSYCKNPGNFSEILINPGESAGQVILGELYPDDEYAKAGKILYRWMGTHYESQRKEAEMHRIAHALNRCVRQTKNGRTRPWATAAKQDEAYRWCMKKIRSISLEEVYSLMDLSTVVLTDDDKRNGHCGLLAWRGKSGKSVDYLSAKKAMTAMYHQLQCIS